jgi:hypothetical protein
MKLTCRGSPQGFRKIGLEAMAARQAADTTKETKSFSQRPGCAR